MKLRIYTTNQEQIALYFSYPKRFASIRTGDNGPVTGLVIECADDENLVPENHYEWRPENGSPSRKIGAVLKPELAPEGLLRQAAEFETFFRDAVRRNDFEGIIGEVDRLASQRRTPKRQKIVRLNNIPLTSKTAARTLKLMGATVNGKQATSLSDKAAEKRLLTSEWRAKDGTIINITT